jgi:hypothetical protein
MFSYLTALFTTIDSDVYATVTWVWNGVLAVADLF